MRLAKPALDVGIQIASQDPAAVAHMLEFYREHVGLEFDHSLPLGGGRMQERHTWGQSVIKLNHSRTPAPDAPATGWGPLNISGPQQSAAANLHDPEGTPISVARAPSPAVGIALRVRDADASEAFFAALGLSADSAHVEVGDSRIELIQDPDAPEHSELSGNGIRYITLQVHRVDAAHAEALAAGASEGMAPKTLGDVARISFVIEPGGNWIELSQRRSVVGTLDQIPEPD